MKEKINIAELLKDCPKGMELDCTMFDDVTFVRVEEDDDRPICIRTGCIYRHLTKFGTWTFDENAKCVIFPKGKTTWEGFQRPFKDGDILFVKSVYSWVLIYKESENKKTLHKYAAISSHPNNKYIVYDNCPLYWKEDVSEIRFATEKEKEKLFKAIKYNGYKWNPETKTLEKLLKFKVGDRVKHKEGYFSGVVTKIDGEYFTIKYDDAIGSIANIKYQDGWELVPNKFDITTLERFDKVLVRQNDYGKWGIDFFGFYAEGFYHTTGSAIYIQCIPYRDNEHLTGKTDDCDEYYKTWEEL